VNWIEDTLRRFGKNMGLGGLSFNEDGVCCLEMERTGELYIEQREEDVFVYLARQVPYPEASLLRKALGLVHFRNGYPLPVAAGVKGDDRLIFVTWVDGRDFSLPVLEDAFRLLKNLFARLNS